MIRRGFWLLAGAVGGIMGYRRASSLGRQVSESLGARPRGLAKRKERHWVRRTIRFSRDVREGMDLYSSRQAGGGESNLYAGPGRLAPQPFTEAQAGASRGQRLSPVHNRDARRRRSEKDNH